MTKSNSECPCSPALVWEGRNGKGESRKGRNRFLKRNEKKRTTQIRPFQCCTQNTAGSVARSKEQPLQLLRLGKATGLGALNPFYPAHQQPRCVCSAVPNGIATYTVWHAAVLGTYAASLRMLVRSYARMYRVVCAGTAVPGQKAMCNELPFAAACCAGAESFGGLADRKMCRALMYAAARCAFAVTSGGLAIIMCRALIDAPVCCACPAMTGGLAIMMCRARIYAAVCCAIATASGGLTIMMCQLQINAAVCCVFLAATGRPSILICHALIYTAVCCSCAAAPGSLAGYMSCLYAAGCCTCDAALSKTAMCFALLYAAVRSACAAAPDSIMIRLR